MKEHELPYDHCSMIYNRQDLEAAQAPVSEWVGRKAVVCSHRGALLGRETEGNLTLCNSVDGPGEHYAKCNKPVRERRAPYDFTQMWNLTNKLNYRTIETDSQTQRHREQTDNCQRGGGLRGWVKKVKGLGKKNHPKSKHRTPRHRQQYGDCQREGVGQVGEGTGVSGDGRGRGLGWWAHSTIYSWCAIELYTWTLCNFINQCYRNTFN